MSYSKGDIVIVPFPFTDLTTIKVRPAIVVSNSLVHRSGDVIIAQITSQSIRGPFAHHITNEDVTIPFKKGRDEMWVYCKKLVTVENRIIHKAITKLKSPQLGNVINKIKSAFD